MDIKEFDPNDALRTIKERIKDAFVSMIPDEQWESMVAKEVENYFKIKVEEYGSRNSVSSFQLDVFSLLSEETKVRTKEYLLKNSSNIWDSHGQPKCNQFIEDIIIKNSGKILSDMIGGHIQSAMNSAGYRL